MATIIREIWGAHPSFLKFPTKRNLLELVAHTPNSGVGLRVVPTVWYKKNWHDSFWTVTEVKMKKSMGQGKIYGRLTWKGKEIPKTEQIRGMLKYNWHLYEPPHELRALEEKLQIPKDAPTA